MNIIATHQLTRRFGRTEAVQDLELTIPQGNVCALLGANGAGKTTTIKMLMNLIAPSSGSAQVLGVDSRRLSPRQLAQIGYVSESQKLPRWMTVRQLLDFCRPLYPTWDRDLERTLLRQFALPEDRQLEHLSPGMVIKATLLSVLAYRPRLLIFDEPFSGLDPLVREDFVQGLLEVMTTGEWTMLISSHEIDEVERLADQVAMIDRGKLQVNESTDRLQGRFRRVEISGGPPAEAPAPGWLEWERAGSLIRFVETNFRDEVTGRLWQERFPGATITARPLTLREIFVVLARANRSNQKGLAA